MRPKLLHSLTRALAIQCALWVAVAPVLPQLHQALAGHRHVFCFEHYRIEDQAAVETRGWSPVQPSGADHESKLIDVESRKTSDRSGVECLSSNFSAPAVFRASVQIATRGSVSLPTIRLVRDVHVQIADTLRIAPKNSPPIG